MNKEIDEHGALLIYPRKDRPQDEKDKGDMQDVPVAWIKLRGGKL
jgi:hypothetical protein